jgi:hypothetical protein
VSNKINEQWFESSEVFNKYNNLRDPYADSKFRILKEMSSKRKGAVFEKIFEEKMIENGHTLLKNLNSDHDRRFEINGEEVKFEIKGSMLWGEDGDSFRWQQIRTSQDYDIMLFMAIYPEEIKFFYATKDEVKEVVEVQDENGDWIYNQHGGKKVNSGTFFLHGMPEDFPIMKEFHV